MYNPLTSLIIYVLFIVIVMTIVCIIMLIKTKRSDPISVCFQLHGSRFCHINRYTGRNGLNRVNHRWAVRN